VFILAYVLELSIQIKLRNWMLMFTKSCIWVST